MTSDTTGLFNDIINAQDALWAKEAAVEQERDLHITMEHSAFAQSGVMALWEECKNILVPHYDTTVQLLQIPLAKFARYVRKHEIPVGIKFSRGKVTSGGAKWYCRYNKNAKQVEYIARGNVQKTAADFKLDFAHHLAKIIPQHIFADARFHPANRVSTATNRRRMLSTT